tara:strand:+ start:325 stop:660 length:336 start_codon:yes stop_codon:yes gene_type:complete
MIDLPSQGSAIQFRVIKDERLYPGFVIRVEEQAKGYLNVCPHMGLRLNGSSGNLLSREGTYIYCYSHGATFEPDSGLCVRGPCEGLSLIPIAIEQDNEKIFLVDEIYTFYD